MDSGEIAHRQGKRRPRGNRRRCRRWRCNPGGSLRRRFPPVESLPTHPVRKPDPNLLRQ
jgi:hypothetical protein